MKMVNVVVIDDDEKTLDELPAKTRNELIDELNRRAAMSLGYIEDKTA